MTADAPSQQHRTDFVNFIKSKTKKGQKCDQSPELYIPQATTKGYWDKPKIRNIMRDVEASQHHQTILDDYAIVFSILVTISIDHPDRIRAIESFMTYHIKDSILPLHEFPPKLNGIISQATWNEFDATQWRFCPQALDPVISSHPQFHRKQILPVTNPVRLRCGRHRKASLFKVEAQQESGLTGNKDSESLAFKTYDPGNEDVGSYHREKELFTWIRNYSDRNHNGYDQHIIQSFGSFSWEDDTGGLHYTVVFELAEGNLLQLFQTGHTPVEFKDIKTFWSSIINVLQGVCLIHNGLTEDSKKIGVHQDLKPENLLLCGDEQSKMRPGAADPFRKCIKIADFGLSHIRHWRGSPSRDAGGTRTYSSPELIHSFFVDCPVAENDDVWAASCILIEAAVWIMGGEDQRQKFREERVKETSNVLAPMFRNSGLGDCFHNSEVVLQCVKDVPKLIEKNGRRSDNITVAVVDDIIRDVLDRPAHSRVNAVQLFNRLSTTIQNAKEPSTRQESPPRTPQRPNGRPLTPATSPGNKRPTVPDIITEGSIVSQSPASLDPQASPRTPNQNFGNSAPTWSQQHLHTNGRSSNPSIFNPFTSLHSTPSRPPSLPVPSALLTMRDLPDLRHEVKISGQFPPRLKAVEKLMKGREIIMVFDDSQHMRDCKSDILQDGPNLVGLLKKIDKNGIDMYCTSSESHGVASSYADADRFLKFNFGKESSEVCFIEHAVGKIVEQITSRWNNNFGRFREKKKISIFFFTNGIWNDTTTVRVGAEKPIINLAKEMKKKNLNRDHVSFQFIRYGNDPLGIQRLKYLDDLIEPETQSEDIVDHKYHLDPLASILIGTLDKDNDIQAPVRQPTIRNSTIGTAATTQGFYS